ncbi:MAG TPA: MotA/TolQ/ExbB proton channel family protein [Gemmatimonadaceae bacterium]|jgi:biopolymer transport protein ExbB|nr:MotA/TolQ/ExbB proton channel family protein [Gemmatimonadaceae bacterium]
MMTLLEYYRAGGPVMHFILAVAVCGLAVFIERFYTIVIRSKINGRAFIERVIQLVRAGKIEDAIKLCQQSNAVLPDMGLLILRSRSRDEADLQNVADAAALSVLPRLTRRLHYLPMLANVATLIGLLGTIFGLRHAFQSVSLQAAAQRSAALASGIAVALNATGFGLLTAVPLSVAHAYLVSQAEGIIEQVDEFQVRLINALIDRPDVRLGHR